MNLPPGPVHLFSVLPFVVLPFAVVYSIINLVSHVYLQNSTPNWLILLLSAISLPALLLVSSVFKEHQHERDAVSRGALMAPLIKSELPLGLSKVASTVWRLSSEFPADTFLGWSEIYGQTFRIKLLGETRVFTTEPEHIKAILATQFDSFVKGPVLFKQFKPLLGIGVFNSDGDMWKFHRTMTRPFFTKERIGDFDVFEKHADDAINQAKARLAQGHPIDFQDLVSRFTLDSASDFLFGNDVCSLSAGLPYPSSSQTSAQPDTHPANRFARIFIEAQEFAAERVRLGPYWPLLEWIRYGGNSGSGSEKGNVGETGKGSWWKGQDRVKVRRDELDSFINPILDKAMERKAMNEGEAGEKDTKEGETLLDHLVNYTGDRQIIKDEILNIMIAGRDTTAATLTFAVYILSMHPHIIPRLREEILDKVGPSRRPTYEEVKEMKYLRAFINETLRLYPPVPFNSRTTTRATVWPAKIPGGNPIYLPAGAKAVYSVMLMHRRKDLWGPDALEFDPDRFLDERLQKYLVPNPFIFLPFNAGPRICLGQQFAYHEASFFLIRLLQHFSGFSLATEVQPSLPTGGGKRPNEKVTLATHLTLYVKGGLWVRMKEANNLDADAA